MTDETAKAVFISAIFNKLLGEASTSITISDGDMLTDESQNLMSDIYNHARKIYEKTASENEIKKRQNTSFPRGDFGGNSPIS